ncbi:MAG: c-type cytochrome biogenesis protein CcsB [Actinomycetota bacterium]
MDAVQLGEWSRNLVTGAVVAYIVAWLAYCAELAVRSRARTADRESVTVAAGQSGSSPSVEHLESAARAGESSQAGERSGQPDRTDRSERMNRIGLSVSTLATLLLAAGVLTRTLAVERAPWGNMHEFSITGALIAAAVFLAVARTRVGRALAIWLVLLLIVTLGMALTVLYVPPGPLVPALQSYWLVLHVGMAVTAFGLFTVAAVVSGLQIAAERFERRRRPSSLPSSGTLDRLAYRLVAVAFPIWTVGPLILGAVWAEASWGRYWGWDPKEVWALVTWLAYAAYLHARATAGWKGTRASVISLIGYATVVFSYFAVNLIFNGWHSYAGV